MPPPPAGSPASPLLGFTSKSICQESKKYNTTQKNSQISTSHVVFPPYNCPSSYWKPALHPCALAKRNTFPIYGNETLPPTPDRHALITPVAMKRKFNTQTPINSRIHLFHRNEKSTKKSPLQQQRPQRLGQSLALPASPSLTYKKGRREACPDGFVFEISQ